ncbi:MAG: hypothetical protein AAF519_07160 [Bacteroidota bacterium]
MKNCLTLSVFLVSFSISAQIPKAPLANDGEGPWPQLIIRCATVIKGDGAPPVGPVDVVVENDRIIQVKAVGYPGVDIDPADRPELKKGGKELEAEAMYLLPGFVDMHGHIGGRAQRVNAEYVFKLWMAHGITTVRDPAAGNGLGWVVDQKEKSAKKSFSQIS